MWIATARIVPSRIAFLSGLIYTRIMGGWYSGTVRLVGECWWRRPVHVAASGGRATMDARCQSPLGRRLQSRVGLPITFQALVLLLILAASAGAAHAQSNERCIALRAVRPWRAGRRAQAWIEEAVAELAGLEASRTDVSAEDGKGKERHDKICSHFRDEPASSLPMLYGCSQRIIAPADRDDAEDKLDLRLAR